MGNFASKFNTVSFGVDTKDFKFVKLEELYKDGGSDKVRKIDGLFVHNGQLGESPIAIDKDNKQLVNLPSFMTGQVRTILGDADAVQAIKAGEVGYTIRTYEARGKVCYAITWVDLVK